MRRENTILFFILFFFSFVAKSQTADDVISKYIAFIGGQKWKAIKTITSTGTYNYGGMEFPFTAYSKAPDYYRYIVAVKEKSFTQAYDGKEGWKIDGFNNEKQKTILKDEQATAMANEADVELESPFINYRQKGHAVALLGMDTTNTQVCCKIKLTLKNGDTSTCFFNRKNFALVKKTALSKNPEMPNTLLDIVYSDYKVDGGVKTPHKISCTADGQNILIITVNSVKLNLPIADSFFKP
jgi:outer membrane lipoprotein-sorting protein